MDKQVKDWDKQVKDWDKQVKDWKKQIAAIDKLIADMRGDKQENFIAENPGREDPIITFRKEQHMIVGMINAWNRGE